MTKRNWLSGVALTSGVVALLMFCCHLWLGPFPPLSTIKTLLISALKEQLLMQPETGSTSGPDVNAIFLFITACCAALAVVLGGLSRDCKIALCAMVLGILVLYTLAALVWASISVLLIVMLIIAVVICALFCC